MGVDMIDLRQGDCLEVMKSIPDGSVDMVLTDPPYGTTKCKWDSVIDFDLMWAELKRIIKPNGAICLFGSEPFSSALRMSNIKQYKYDWKWDKVVGSNYVQAKKQPLRVFEDVIIFYQKQPKYNPQMTKRKSKDVRKSGMSKDNSINGLTKMSGVFTGKYKYPVNKIEVNKLKNELNSRYLLHPTQKPVALLEYLIKTYTDESETVLDFTMGVGSTGVAAVNTNRNFIGIELGSNYFKIAEDRINQAATDSGFLTPE